MGLAGIVLLLLPLVPGSASNINGARIWIRFGGFSFQPGEIAKICLAIFFAGYLVVKRDALALAGRRFLGVDLPRGRDLGPIVADVADQPRRAGLPARPRLVAAVLRPLRRAALCRDRAARAGWSSAALLFAAGAYLGYLAFGHVQTRVDGWLHPFSNTDAYYQIIQGQYGLAWGGILGRGWGQGSPQLTPYAWTDFIAHVARRGARPHRPDGDHRHLRADRRARLPHRAGLPRPVRQAARRRARRSRSRCRCSSSIGGVTRLIPLTGLTTPFLSYGGSSLIANWIMVALILRISDHARRPVPDLAPADARRRDPGGEDAMNKPIRTLAVGCLRAVRAAADQHQLRAGVQGRRPQRLAAPTSGRATRSARVSAARSWSTATASPAACRPTTASSTSARYSRAQALCAGHRLLLLLSTAPRARRGHRELDPVGKRQPAVRQPQSSIWSATTSRRAAACSLTHRTRPPSRPPTTGCRRCPARPAAPSWPSTRRPAPSWRRSSTPSYNPNLIATPRLRRQRKKAYDAAQHRPGRRRCSTAAPRRSTRRARRSSSSMAAAALSNGYTPEQRRQGRRVARPAPDDARCCTTRTARTAVATQITLTQALVVSCNVVVRRPRAQARGRPAARPGREVRLQRGRHRPAAGVGRASSRRTSTSRRPRCRRSASSTSRRRPCRWPWWRRASPTAATVMRPYVVQQVRSPDLDVLDEAAAPRSCTRRSSSAIASAI